MFYKVPNGCNDLSLGGVNVAIIDGIINVEGHHLFLIENGFTEIDKPIVNNLSLEEAKAKADELGIQYAPNIGLPKLLEKISEAELTKTGGEV